MDVITRAEFDDSMKNFPTQDALVSAVREAIRENLDDLKIDLSAQIEEKVTKSHNILGLSSVRTSDLRDAKNEILATMRRNIGEAIDPLKADLHKVGERVDTMWERVDTMGDRVDTMGDRVDKMGDQVDKMGDQVDKMGERVDKMGDRVDKMGERVDKMGDRVDKLGEQVDQMGERIHKMGARVDEMHATFKSVADGHLGLDEKLTRLGDEMRETWKRYERTLDRHDADLYKLRQSGVLQ